MYVNNLCRICVSEISKNKDVQALFDETKDCIEIVRKIEECGGIKLKPLDEFPKNICIDCLESLNVSYKFRSLCQASETSLLDMIVKYEIPPGPPKINNLLSEGFISKRDDIFAHYLNTNEEISVEGYNDIKDEVETRELLEEFEYHDINARECESSKEGEGHNNDEESDIKKSKTRENKGSSYSKKKIKGKRGRPPAKHITINESNQVKKLGKCGRKKAEENEERIICEICGNIYTKRSLLNMHMRRHTGEKPFECEICGKNFACASQMARHIRVHTGEKPHVCRFCGRTFTDRSTNIKHERIHTNERPFECKTCGKSFTYSNVLKNHMLTHTGEKPFTCVPCSKTFSRKHQLDQHIGTSTHQKTVRMIYHLSKDNHRSGKGQQ